MSGNFDVDRAATLLDLNGYTRSGHHCGVYVQEAIRAGGRPGFQGTNYAKNFGPSLLQAGFTTVSLVTPSGPFLKGDVVIIQSYPDGNPAGHIAMFDGAEWVSDFYQGHKTDVYSVGPGYRKARPIFTVYRAVSPVGSNVRPAHHVARPGSSPKMPPVRAVP